MDRRATTMLRKLARVAEGRALLASLTFFFTAYAAGGQTTDGKSTGHEQTLIELRAVITGVDQRRRLLALRSDDGPSVVIAVAEAFRGFDKLRVGDAVVVSHTQAIAWQVKPANRGAAIEGVITTTAAITAFDAARGTVTFTGPDGQSETLKANNPADLERLRVGDLVDITYSKVRAFYVRTADKR